MNYIVIVGDFLPFAKELSQLEGEPKIPYIQEGRAIFQGPFSEDIKRNIVKAADRCSDSWVFEWSVYLMDFEKWSLEQAWQDHDDFCGRLEWKKIPFERACELLGTDYTSDLRTISYLLHEDPLTVTKLQNSLEGKGDEMMKNLLDGFTMY